jgi:hypothetical protein
MSALPAGATSPALSVGPASHAAGFPVLESHPPASAWLPTDVFADPLPRQNARTEGLVRWEALNALRCKNSRSLRRASDQLYTLAHALLTIRQEELQYVNW